MAKTHHDRSSNKATHGTQAMPDMHRKKDKKKLNKEITTSSSRPETCTPKDAARDVCKLPMLTEIMKTMTMSGGNVSQFPLRFLPDSEYFAACVGHAVRIYRTSSGDCFQNLRGHLSAVVGLEVNPQNAYQLYTASQDGTLMLWDREDGTMLKSVALGMAVDAMNVLPADKHGQERFLVLSQGRRSMELITVKNDLVVSSQTVFCSVASQSAGQAADGMVYSVGKNGKYVFIASGCQIQVYSLEQSRFVLSFNHDKIITCIAAHPQSETMFATGDAKGKIFLWYPEDYDGSHSSRPSFSKLHWHAFAVQALAFSPDGLTLLSGGQEGVLVAWHLPTRQPRFLPRFGATVKHVASSPDGRMYLVSTEDNSIYSVTTFDWQAKRVVAGLKCADNAASSVSMAVDEQDGTVAIAGAHGSIQFWNPSTGRLLLDMDVAERPRLLVSDTGRVESNRVTHMALSRDGVWLATVDERHMKTAHQPWVERSLKFWRKCSQAGIKSYQLVTRIRQPHAESVTGLAFHPRLSQGASSVLCATTSADGEFKVWQVQSVQMDVGSVQERRDVSAQKMEQRERPVVWCCRSTGSWRGEPAVGLTFSFDGSLLAVAYPDAVTFWNPMTNTLMRVLMQPNGVILDSVHWFTAYSSRLRARNRYLLLSGRRGDKRWMGVWDVVLGRLNWSKELDAADCRFALDGHRGEIVMTYENIQKSERVVEVLVPETHRAKSSALTQTNVVAMATLSSSKHCHLLFVDHYNTLSTWTPVDKETEVQEQAEQKQVNRITSNNPYLSSVVKTPKTLRQASLSANTVASAVVPGRLPSFMDAPSYTLSSLSFSFDAFMKNRLRVPVSKDEVMLDVGDQVVGKEEEKRPVETVKRKTVVPLNIDDVVSRWQWLPQRMTAKK